MGMFANKKELLVVETSTSSKITKGTPNSAGFDITSNEDILIRKNERKWVGTGIKIKIPDGYFGLLKSKSGLSGKGVDIGAGVLDSDYVDEIKVLICYNGEDFIRIEKGMKIAQIVIMKYKNIPIKIVDVLPKPVVEHKGFGSTGE